MLAIALTFATSCEDNNDSSSKSASDNNYLQEETVQIATHDYTPSGVVWRTADGKYAIMYDNSSTVIMMQRESCSGFSEGGSGDLHGTATIKFTQSEIDWSSKPYLVVPSEIWVYRDECINPPSGGADCIPCQTETNQTYQINT